MPVNVNKVWK